MNIANTSTTSVPPNPTNPNVATIVSERASVPVPGTVNPSVPFELACRLLEPGISTKTRRKRWLAALSAAGFLDDPSFDETLIAEAVLKIQMDFQDPTRRDRARAEVRTEMAKRHAALKSTSVKPSED